MPQSFEQREEIEEMSRYKLIRLKLDQKQPLSPDEFEFLKDFEVRRALEGAGRMREREKDITARLGRGESISSDDAVFLVEIAKSRALADWERERKEEERKEEERKEEERKEEERKEEERKEEERKEEERKEEEPIEEEIEKKTLETLLQQLNEARELYIQSERKLSELRREIKEGKSGKAGVSFVETEYQNAKIEYETIKVKYARALYQYKRQQLEKTGLSEEEINQEMAKFKAVLFEDLVIGEADRLAQAKLEDFEPRKRNWFRRLMENWAKMPLWKRAAITAGITTGALAAGGVLGGLAAAAIFGAERFIRGIVSGKVAGFTFAAIKMIGSRRIEKYRQAEIDKLNNEFGTKIEEKIASEQELREMFRDITQEYEKIVRETNRRYRNVIRWAIAGSAIAGLGTGMLLAAMEPHFGGVTKGTTAPAEKTPSTVPETPSKPGVPTELAGGRIGIYEYIVQKGESPLSIAKKFFIENAEKFGYKPEMGDVSRWAEIFSARHIVGQYIQEHLDQFKDLIGKIGPPPADPIELNKWLHQVPKPVFDDILHNKVPNLIFPGDKIVITENGDVAAFSPEGILRTGHIPPK
jgi:hypothetical protein